MRTFLLCSILLCSTLLCLTLLLPVPGIAAPFDDAASVSVGGEAAPLMQSAVPAGSSAPSVALVDPAAASSVAATPAASTPAPAGTAAAKPAPKKRELPWYVTGKAELLFQLSSIRGSQASANEYGLRDTGPVATVIVDMGNDSYVASFEGQAALDLQPHSRDQGFLGDTYDLKAAFSKINYYKISAYRNTINHNISDGKTRMSDVGGRILMPSKPTDPVTNFTYNKRRINTGMEAEISWDSPFFVNMAYDQQKVDGLLPKYNYFSGTTIVPAPVSYQVDAVSLQAGVRTKAVTALFDASISNLTDSVNWLYGAGGGYPGAPISNYQKRPLTPSTLGKYGASLAWRLPEWSTTLQMRFSQSYLTAGDYATNSKYSAPAPGVPVSDLYSGNIVNTYGAASLTSSPIKGFTSRVYVNYHNRDNQNSLDDRNTLNASYRNQLYNGFYSFNKITSGLELSYRFSPDYKVTSGYEFYQMDRSRYTFGHVPYTIDNRVWGQLDAEVTDWLGARLKYQFLDRNSAKNRYAADVPLSSNSNQAYVDYTSFADSASKTQNMLKLSLDFSLLDNLGLTLEYALKQDNYTRKQALGMDTAYRHDFLADANYSIGPVKLNAYGGVELSKYSAQYRKYTDVANANPGLAPTKEAYNWDMKQSDTSYVFGGSVTWDVVPKSLNLKVSYDAERADGRTDIGTQAPVSDVLGNVSPVDRYQRDSLEARLTHNMSDTQSLSVGYRYDYLKYTDWAYDGMVDTDAQSYYGVARSYSIHTAFVSYQYTF